MSLIIEKNATLTGQSMVDGKQVVYLNASLSTDSEGRSTISQNISDQELYNAHRAECRKDIAEFQTAVYELEDYYVQEVASK